MLNFFRKVKAMMKSKETLISAEFIRGALEGYTDEALLTLCQSLGLDVRRVCANFLATCPQSALDEHYLRLDANGDPDRPSKPLPMPRTLEKLADAAVAFGRKVKGIPFSPTIDTQDKMFWREVEQRTRGMDRRQREQVYSDLHGMLAGTRDRLQPLPEPEPIKTAGQLEAEHRAAHEKQQEHNKELAREIARVQGRPEPIFAEPAGRGA